MKHLNFILVFLLVFCLSLEQTAVYGQETVVDPVIAANTSATSNGTPYPITSFDGVNDGLTTALTYMAAIIVAFLGVSIPMMCKISTKAPSLILFELGSVIYLIGELYTTFQYKKLAMDSLTVYLNDGLDKQITSLQEIKKMNQGYLNTLKLKYYLAIAVSIAYVIAAVVAIWESFKPNPPDICTSKKNKESKEKAGDKPATTSPTSSPTSSPTTSPTSSPSSTPSPTDPRALNPTTSFLIFPSSFHLINEVMAADSSTDTSSDIKSILGFDNLSLSSLGESESIIKLVLLGMGGALGAGLAYAFNHTSSALSAKFALMINKPMTRIILFFACAAIIGTLILLLTKQQKKLEDRITYLDNAIKTLQGYATSEAGNLSSITSGNNYLTAADYIPPIVVSSENMGQVATSASGGLCLNSSPNNNNNIKVDSSCACAKTSSGCQISNLPNTESSSAKFPSSMVSALNNSSGAIKNLANGKVDAAISGLSSVAKQAGNIQKIQKQSVDKLQERLSKVGQGPIQFKKEQEKVFESIKSKLKQGLKEANIKDSDMAKMGNNVFSLGNEGASKQNAGGEITKLPSSETGKSAGSEANTDKNKKNDEFMLGNINLDDNSNKDLSPAVLPSDGADYILDSGEKAELQDANGDIFQILSSRYSKTAYPLFFLKK